MNFSGQLTSSSDSCGHRFTLKVYNTALIVVLQMSNMSAAFTQLLLRAQQQAVLRHPLGSYNGSILGRTMLYQMLYTQAMLHQMVTCRGHPACYQGWRNIRIQHEQPAFL